mmetsp:Transcript_54412/g.102043  ORF Transcript_54412/g.102043 Transcript_54412/m.102043 type:complete len:347 (+) Transcript_54412:153-1193(+)
MSYSCAVSATQLILPSRSVVARIPFSLRWNVAAVGSALSLVGLLFCHIYTTEDTIHMGFAVALACVALMGASSGIWQACAFGLAGCLSPKFAQSVMFGQGLGGVFAGVVGTALSASSVGLAFSFIFSAAFQLLGAPVLYPMASNQYVREVGALKPPATESAPSPPGSPTLTRGRSSREILVQNAWPQALTVCAVFTFSFTIFPGVTSRFSPGGRVPLLISLFQLMDVVGRFAPQLAFFQISQGWVVSLLAALRVFFIPLFIALQRESLEPWAQNAYLQILVMAIFAFSNGWVSTLSMMLGPEQRGVSADEREPVGTMMSLSLVSGIWLGSVLALFTQIGMKDISTC